MRAIWSIFRIQLLARLQYRLAALAGASTSFFWGLVHIIIIGVFYRFAENQGAALAAGMSWSQAVSYTWLGQGLLYLLPMKLDDDILKKITEGSIGVELCRPLDLQLHWFARTLATRLVPLLFHGLPVLLVALLLPEGMGLGPPASLGGLLVAGLSVVSALLLSASVITLGYLLRLDIAWGEGPMQALFLMAQLLSGNYLPLQLWPEALQPFLLYQPFAGLLDLPARLYVGTLPVSAVWQAVGLQLVWLAAFVLAGRLLMERHLKRLVVQGG